MKTIYFQFNRHDFLFYTNFVFAKKNTPLRIVKTGQYLDSLIECYKFWNKNQNPAK